VEVGIRVGGNLRQVGNADDLKRGTQRSQLSTDHVGNPTADAGIHFVKDETGRAGARRSGSRQARTKGQRLDGQHHARQLATRNDAGQRAQLLARIRRHEELHFIDPPAGPRRFCDGPRVPVRVARAARVEPHVESRLPERQVRKQALPSGERMRTFRNRGSAGGSARPLEWMTLAYRFTADIRGNDSFAARSRAIGNSASIPRYSMLRRM